MKRAILHIAGLGGLILTLFLALISAEGLWLPPAFEPAGRIVSRTAWMICAPMMRTSEVLFARPWHGHHWGYEHFGFASITTALFAYGAAILIVSAMRRRSKERAPARPNADNPSRREFLLRAAYSGAIAVPAAGLGGYTMWIEPQRLMVRRYTMPVADLPAGLDGLRIVQVSDTHYGPYMALPFLRDAVNRANALKPDVVILTGDYVHRTTKAIPDGVGLLRGLESRFGAVAVLGNHDHWEDADACRERFGDIGIPLIDNSRRFLTAKGFTNDAPDDGGLCFAGVGDYWEDAVDFSSALAGAPETVPRILLSHNPDVAENALANRFRIDFMCSGHTHGGQVRLPGLGTPIVPSAYGQKYAGGVCHGPQFPVVVSRGVGMAVLPVRFAVPPELVFMELRVKT